MPLKKIILSILLLMPLLVLGQQNTLIYTGADSQTTIQKGGYGAERVFVVPRDSNENALNRTRKDGRIAVVGGTFTWFDSLQNKWVMANSGGGGSIDTTSLSNRINLKLNITDTTNNWLTQLFEGYGINITGNPKQYLCHV